MTDADPRPPDHPLGSDEVGVDEIGDREAEQLGRAAVQVVAGARPDATDLLAPAEATRIGRAILHVIAAGGRGGE